MKQLTKAQKLLLEEAQKEVAFAKKFSNSRDYYLACETQNRRYDKDFVEYKTKMYDEDIRNTKKDITSLYNKLINNIVLTYCNGSTLKVLARLGYVEIIKDSTGTGVCGIDTIKLLVEA